MTIRNKAMLVDLTIRKWDATKYDKKVSAEVEAKHAARDAGRYNKRIIDKAHLATIENIASQIRKYHYNHTLPWNDKGPRLLPSTMFMDYRQNISSLKQQFQSSVAEFLKLYPTLVQDARVRLGSMYSPSDYPQPNALLSLFDVSIEIMPLPDAGDFRVDVAEETQNEIRQQIASSLASKQANAVRDCWCRIRDVVSRIAEQCGKENGRIHDSLMNHAHDLVSVLDKLNITSDSKLSAIANKVNSLLVAPDVLRSQPLIRSEIALGATHIINIIDGEGLCEEAQHII